VSLLAARWLDRAPEGWDRLVAGDPAASPTHRPEVWEAFAATLPGHRVHVLAIEERGELAGGVPLVELRRGPLAWLYALPVTLPAPPVARPGAHAAVFARAATEVAALAREVGAVGGTWSWYRACGDEPYPRDAASSLGETRTIEASVIDLAGGLEGARARLGRKERATLRHAAGLYAFSDDPAQLETAHALHAAQSSRWGGHRVLPLELSRRLLGWGGADPPARLFSLADTRGVVSAALALDGPHETFVWWSGTHPAGREHGAFTRLLWGIVEWAAARGRARVNVGASTGLPGVASFKRSLGITPVRYPVVWLDGRHAGPLGRAMLAVRARLRPAQPPGEPA
jgi:hypothetical protein